MVWNVKYYKIISIFGARSIDHIVYKRALTIIVGVSAREYGGSATHTFWYYYHFAGEAALFGGCVAGGEFAAQTTPYNYANARAASLRRVKFVQNRIWLLREYVCARGASECTWALAGCIVFHFKHMPRRDRYQLQLCVCMFYANAPRHRARILMICALCWLIYYLNVTRRAGISPAVVRRRGVWKVNKM